MKKLLFIASLFVVLGFAKLSAQSLPCSNNTALEARIDAIEASGFTEVNRVVYYVAYLLPPDPPYLTATMEVTFVGDYCGPACTPIMRTETWDAYVKNAQGNCVWQLGNN